jgi:RND family efflux transporter MFP subunit
VPETRSRPVRGLGVGGARAGLVLLATLLACGEEAPPPPEPVRPVKLLEIPGEGATATREYLGTVRAAQTAEMAFEVPGRIVEFLYKEGQPVEEGAVLARLDPRDYQSAVDSARAQYENSRVNIERAEKLVAEGVLAPVERDRRRAEFETDAARLREATKALEDTELRAPFSGVMARKLVEDFANVQAKQVVLILTAESSFEIKLNVPERDLAGRRTGRSDPEEVTERVRPEVIVTALPDLRFPARLTEVASTADPETRTFEVTVAFEPPEDVRVLPGMTAKVVIHVPAGRMAERGVRIPATAALADDEGRPFVWVVDPGSMTVSPRPVELGDLTGRDVEVRAGLSPGDVVAVSGVHELRDGMTVRRFEP